MAPFVSFAQNLEDVLLWRALRDVGDGFWIDAGAWEPRQDSVTLAFSRRGWRGINIEPAPGPFARLARARPRDVNLQVAVGREAGTLPLFVIGGGNGLTTLDPGLAAGYARQGHAVEEVPVAVTTLAALWHEHVAGPVHFLKIDVEGAERAVLEGADLERNRPWIVLIEATRPTTQEPSHGEWEPLLLDAGYRFVWFDGLNRFYLAEEWHARLAPAFAAPPNVFDHYVTAREMALRRRLREAEARAAAAEARAEAVGPSSGTPDGRRPNA